MNDLSPREQLASLSRELETIDQEILRWKNTHGAVVNGTFVLLSSKITSRSELDREWAALLRRRDSVFAPHQRLMQECAGL